MVIGGGVIGLSAALWLRRAGVSVTVLERGECGREASWAAAGVLSPPNPHRTDPLFHIHQASLGMYREFCEELKGLTGIDPQYIRSDALDLLTTEQAVQMAKSDVRAMGDGRTEDGRPLMEVLTADEARVVEPGVGDAPAYLLDRRTAQVRNPRLMQALTAACEKLGVVIEEDCTVTGLIREGSRVRGVTADTSTHFADFVVLAAGAWSTQVLDESSAPLVPVHPVRGQMILLCTERAPFSHIINMKKTYLVPRCDGLILLGATVEPEAGFDKHNTAAGVGKLMADAMAMMPCLAEAPVAAMWAGFRPGTPDSRPHIGAVPGSEGLIAATGHFRTGLALAPITARIVCELVTAGKTSFDLSRCAPGRDVGGA